MHVPDELINQAFALSRARGAELLAFLGHFDVWQGDLAEMRGDSPHVMQDGVRKQPSPAKRDLLADVLVMARAIELLDSNCRATLVNVYGRRDTTTGERQQRDTRSGDGENLASCKSRLVEIYAQLQDRSSDHSTPEWVAEREHAAMSASHGRGRR